MKTYFERGSAEHLYHTCGRKRRHQSEQIAKAEAKKVRAKTGQRLRPYQCRHCGDWHLGHHRSPSNLNRFIETIKSEPGGECTKQIPGSIEA